MPVWLSLLFITTSGVLLNCASTKTASTADLGGLSAQQSEVAIRANRYVELKKELEELERWISDQPWPFKDDLSEDLAPSILAPRLKKAAEEMNLHITFLDPDCSEYPCLFIGNMKPGDTKGFWSTPALHDLKSKERSKNIVQVGMKNCDHGFFAAVVYNTGPLTVLLDKRITARTQNLAERLSGCPNQ